jgi:transcriptional regulator GlxA family with amidase domain
LTILGKEAVPPLTRIIPALVHIQAHLDQDLSLDALAGHVGLSKYFR